MSENDVTQTNDRTDSASSDERDVSTKRSSDEAMGGEVDTVDPVIADDAGSDGADATNGDAGYSAAPSPLADPRALRAAVEAVLFVVEAPVSLAQLAASLQRPLDEVESAVDGLAAGLEERASGIELRRIAGGVRLYTHPAQAAWIEAFLLDGQRSKLTQAALETLSVIAYRQPVTRARISAIRGVNVDGVVRTLLTRGLIVEVGADPDTGGGLYRTTDLFLEKMGLQSLHELPSLAPLLPELDGFESDEL